MPRILAYMEFFYSSAPLLPAVEVIGLFIKILTPSLSASITSVPALPLMSNTTFSGPIRPATGDSDDSTINKIFLKLLLKHRITYAARYE